MNNTELKILSKQIASMYDETNDTLNAYEAINNIGNMHRGVSNHLVAENNAYVTTAKQVLAILGASKDSPLPEIFPVSLDELDQEAFKARITKVAETAWKAIAEAFAKFAKIITRWYNRLKEALFGNAEKAATAMDDVQAMMEESDRIAQDHGFVRGDVIPEETIKMINESTEHGVVVDSENRLLTSADLEKDIFLIAPSLKANGSMLASLSRDNKTDNIEANVEEALQVLNELINTEHLNDVILYLRNLTGISTNDDLRRFVDEDTRLPLKAMRDMIKNLKLEGKKDIERDAKFVSKEIIGGYTLKMQVNQAGNFLYPRFDENKMRVTAGAPGSLRFKELLACIKAMSNFSEVIIKSSEPFDMLSKEADDIMAGNGTRLKEISNSIMDAANERDAADAKKAVAELRQINSIINGWVSAGIKITSICNNTITASEKIAGVVLNEVHGSVSVNKGSANKRKVKNRRNK